MARNAKTIAKGRLKEAVEEFNALATNEETSDQDLSSAAEEVAYAEFLANEEGVSTEEMERILRQ